jgi:hypothetical protein
MMLLRLQLMIKREQQHEKNGTTASEREGEGKISGDGDGTSSSPRPFVCPNQYIRRFHVAMHNVEIVKVHLWACSIRLLRS